MPQQKGVTIQWVCALFCFALMFHLIFNKNTTVIKENASSYQGDAQ